MLLIRIYIGPMRGSPAPVRWGMERSAAFVKVRPALWISPALNPLPVLHPPTGDMDAWARPLAGPGPRIDGHRYGPRDVVRAVNGQDERVPGRAGGAYGAGSIVMDLAYVRFDQDAGIVRVPGGPLQDRFFTSR